MAKLYPDLTASFITESLFNVYTKDVSKKKSFESINALMFDWDVETNYVKYVEFADIPTETGEVLAGNYSNII